MYKAALYRFCMHLYLLNRRDMWTTYCWDVSLKRDLAVPDSVNCQVSYYFTLQPGTAIRHIPCTRHGGNAEEGYSELHTTNTAAAKQDEP